MKHTVLAFIQSFVSALFAAWNRGGKWQNRMMLLSFGSILVLGTFVILALVSSSATAGYELPPREEVAAPSPGVTTQQDFGVQVGVRIHLEGMFPADWPWETMHWQQDLWHEVEWYDPNTGWHRVDGWKGNFDTIYQEDGVMIARKEYWAGSDQIGAGPFRWLVYQGENGRLLTNSESFNLPSAQGGIVTVRLSMIP